MKGTSVLCRKQQRKMGVDEMLAGIMEKFKVVNSLGNNIGKVKDIYIDLDNWRITGFQVSPGPLKKDFILNIDEVVKFDETDKIIIVDDELEKKEAPNIPMMNLYPFNEIKKHNVVDRQGEKLGKIYNLEIPYEKLKVFKVWKLLIKTGFTERRLRLPPSEVVNVIDDINLKGLMEDYREEDE